MKSLQKRWREISGWFASSYKSVREALKNVYLRLNKLTGGSLGIMRHAFTNFSIMRGPEAAASLSYYALFSIFPALLAVVSIGSLFLEQAVVRSKLLDAVTQFLPVSATLINELISGVLDKRGAFTIVAILSLLWSGSNVFDKIIVNVNRAFSRGRTPGFFRSRGIALIIILVLIVLFLGSLMIDTIQGFFRLEEAYVGEVRFIETPLYEWLRWLLPLLIKFFLFLAVYTWIPRTREIRFRARLIGAAVAAGLWELATRALTWALSQGFTNFELIYGSLSSIIALMTWMYLSGYILFWGAHLTYAVNYHLATTQSMKAPGKKGKAERQLGTARND
ncbi:MAG: YihY/virulence factor BrkB family protein [Chloroflexi bacterium]|nr:YihY/virulence factor BrkB family protein [Chloroflexota bacterium]